MPWIDLKEKKRVMATLKNWQVAFTWSLQSISTEVISEVCLSSSSAEQATKPTEHLVNKGCSTV